ncbi:22069_t:CDS:2, partial [Rhizophagus irregularis]
MSSSNKKSSREVLLHLWNNENGTIKHAGDPKRLPQMSPVHLVDLTVGRHLSSIGCVKRLPNATPMLTKTYKVKQTPLNDGIKEKDQFGVCLKIVRRLWHE